LLFESASLNLKDGEEEKWGDDWLGEIWKAALSSGWLGGRS